MSDLNRVQVGDFNIQKAVRIDELKDGITKNFVTIEEFFNQNEKITLDANQINRFLNGVRLKKELRSGIYNIYNRDNIFIGVGISENGDLKRDIIVI